MVLTNDTRLQIKRHITDLFIGQSITDQKQIAFAIKAICNELENREDQTMAIDNHAFVGVAIPVALMHQAKYTPVSYNNKKYLSFTDDTICIFASRNYAKLIKESVTIMEPNGWGDSEDVMMSSPVYTHATCADMDAIYDTVY